MALDKNKLKEKILEAFEESKKPGEEAQLPPMPTDENDPDYQAQLSEWEAAVKLATDAAMNESLEILSEGLADAVVDQILNLGIVYIDGLKTMEIPVQGDFNYELT